MDDKKENMLGCYVSTTMGNYNDGQKEKDLAAAQGKLFRTYVWGESGIRDALKKIRHQDYGEDLLLVLFQFYVNPLPIELHGLKEIENYKKREKAIGIPIIVNKENFFDRSEVERYQFLKQSIFEKLDLVAEIVKKKKLDTKIDLLKSDLQKILN